MLGLVSWGTSTSIKNNTGLDRVQTDPEYNFKNLVFNETDNNDSTPYHNIGHSCEYFEQNEFSDKVKNISKQISTFSHNIRSLPGKWNEFSQHIQDINTDKFKFSVICLQEVWNVPEGVDYDLEGYKPFHFTVRDPKRLNSNAGGGVGLWVDDNFEFDPIDEISIFEPHVFESQFIKLKTAKNKFTIIGNIYRPNTAPMADIVRFNELLDEILATISNDPVLKKAEDIQIVSDSNIDMLQYQNHTHTRTYIDTLLTHGQLPLITLPTRITATTATVIDHISTSKKADSYDSGIIISSLSDHLPVFYIKYSHVNRASPKEFKSRKINSKTIPEFENLLQSTDWTNVTTENRPKEAFQSFFDALGNCVDRAFPETIVKTNQKLNPINPWMTNALMTSRKSKEKLGSKKIRNPTTENISAFKNFNRIYNKLVRASKINYYNTKFTEYSTNMRKTWDTIRDVIGSKKRRDNVPDYFKRNGKIITGSIEIAEEFNSFFAGIGPELANSIRPSQLNFKTFLGNSIRENFIFNHVTSEMIIEMAGKLKSKNSSGPDRISSKLLKKILPIIITPLCHIFNLSLKTGYIPTILKTAKVVPVFKSGDKHDFTNYRPISLLSSFAKLLEKIVSKQVFGFLYKHRILYKHQYGFRKGHSTSHPLVHFLDKIHSALNKNDVEYTISVFLDLKKAFDTVDHTILLKKMDHYGFRGIANNWFENYLRNRVQYVVINGKNSTPLSMECGVPQGSVLGPLLFLIFINDLPNATNFFTLLFADDTTFQFSSKELDFLATTANCELEKASNWFQVNKLTLNVSKTKYILFRSKNMAVDFTKLQLKIGDESIERIGSNCKKKFFKFVGHHLDEFLTWEHQISHVHGKLASANYAIARTKNFLPTKIRKTLYNSLFKSHLEFGILAWGGISSNKLKKFTKIQKKCIRNVAGKGHRSHTDPLFSYLNILKFEDLFKYNCSNFMQKYNSNKQPESFKDMFQPLSEPNRTNGYVIPRIKNKFLDQFPTSFLPKIWNDNSLIQKNIKSSNLFKNSLKKSFIAAYPPMVHCDSASCNDCNLPT